MADEILLLFPTDTASNAIIAATADEKMMILRIKIPRSLSTYYDVVWTGNGDFISGKGLFFL